MTPDPAYDRERLGRLIRTRLQDAVGAIGNPSHQSTSLDQFDYQQMIAYATGVKHTLQVMVEDLELGSDTFNIYDQIEGALGERWRRLYPEVRFFKSLKLDRLLGRVRDLRISLGNYELLNYERDYKPLQQKVRTIERHGAETAGDLFWDELRRLQDELRALWSHYNQLIGDSSWYAEVHRRSQMKTPELAA